MKTAKSLAFDRRFLQELEEIVDYISLALASPQAAESLLDAVYEAVKTRMDFPQPFAGIGPDDVVAGL